MRRAVICSGSSRSGIIGPLWRKSAAMGGPVPEDEYGRDDNVLLQTDDVSDFVPARHLRDLDEGWSVRFLMDRWEAFSMYGYDAGDMLG